MIAKLIDLYIFQLRQLNVQSHELDFSESDVQDLKGFAQGFQAAIDDQIVILNPLCGVEFHGDFIFTLMEKSNVIIISFFFELHFYSFYSIR